MLDKLVRLPLRAARKAVGLVRPGKKASSGPLHYTPGSGGLKRPPEAVRAAPPPPPPYDDDDHGHSHSHSHGHSHDHGHGHGDDAPEAAAAPVATVRAASVRVTAEETPNPNAMKFVVSQKVVAKGSVSFNAAAEAAGNALGEALFAVAGVRTIFAVNDFVTVTKDDDARWADLVPAVTKAIQSAC